MNQDERTATAAPVKIEPLGCIQLAIPLDYTFLLHWVRRVSLRDVVGDLGTRLRSPRPAMVNILIESDFRMVQSVDAAGRVRLRVYKSASASKIAVTAAVTLPQLSDSDPVLKTVFGQNTVRDSIYHLAPQALQAQFGRRCAEVLDADRENPLLDASFASTEQGLAALARALEGDFTGSGIEFRKSTLMNQLNAQAVIELYLPQLDRRDWKRPADAIERSRVRCNEAGQIFVGWPEQKLIENTLRMAGFAAFKRTSSLATASVNCGGAVKRQIPASYLTNWFDAPGDREIKYAPAYGEIALSVQRVLREELPRLWFSSPERYARVADSHAMLVYKCSSPFLGRTRTEFSYEFQNPTSMRRFYRTANQAMPAELERIQTILSGSDLARHYQPIFSRDIVGEVASRERNLHRLMFAESAIIECFIQFGMVGHEFRYRTASPSRQTAEGVARYAADFATSLISRTKRIHPTMDCGDLALPLLMEASRALNAVLRGETGMEFPEAA